MGSLTEDLQAGVRLSTGTSYTFNGDLHAYLDTLAIPTGQINERMIAYVSTLDATISTASGALNYALLNPQNFISPFATASFFAPLTSSLALTRGTGSATFTRATTATVMGFAPDALLGDAQVLLTVAAGEARFTGARRISQGVWSDYYADGTLIPEALRLGYLAEGAATNLFLNSAVGVTQTTPTLTAASYTLSFKGTGTITGTGGFIGTLNGTGATNRVSLTVTATAAAATLTVTGSCTEVQLELGSFATSYIPTTSTAVTRNADVLTYPSAGNAAANLGSMALEWTPEATLADTATFDGNGYCILLDLGVANYALGRIGNKSVLWRSAAPLISNLTWSPTIGGVTYKEAGVFGNIACKTALSGIVSTPSAVQTGSTIGTTISIGKYGGGNMFSATGNIRNVRLWTTQLTDAQLVQMTL